MFEYNKSKSSDNMVITRETNDPRQSHGLKVFVEPTQCQIGTSQSLCEIDLNIGFRYYQFDVEATDFAGNVGTARAFVVVVPDGFDRVANQDPKHFINLMNLSPAINVIQTIETIGDTTESDLFL